MIKSWISFILVFTLILLSCKKKDENYIISGKIVNPELNAPVAHVSVTLYGTKISGGVVQSQQEKLATAISSTDGSFQLKFNKQVFSSLKIVLSKEGHFYKEQLINPDNLNPGEEYNINLQMHAMSWLKTIVRNVGSQYTSDQLFYRLSFPYSNCNTCCPTSQRIFNGVGIDTSWICPVYGGNYVYVLWIYSSGQNSVPHNDTLFIPIGDTVLHPVFY